MNHIKITDRNEETVSYAVYTDKDEQIKQSTLPIAPLLEKVKSKRWSLERVIAAEEGAS